jgi:ADP-heptose:LPS heptosyltransferase
VAVVVLRALGLGDTLTGIPALRAVVRAFPDSRRVLVAPRPVAPLLELARVPFEVCDHAGLGPLPSSLPRPSVAVNLHGRGPQSHEALRALGPERLVAFGCGGVAWRAGEHEVERWCRLLSESGIPADPSELDIDAPSVEPPSAAVGATLIHPGAASGARRWPVARFASLARELDRVAITGSAAERPLALAVADAAGIDPRRVLAGRTDLIGLAACVAAADRVVCGDTGVAHLATALGTPSVVLFGPVPPAEWGPPVARPRHRALWAGRRGDPHAAAVDRGLLEISVDDVLAAAGLESAGSRGRGLHRP